ncbi:serine/threonine protein kinase [Sphingobium sp. UBA5915]|uniref:serine/threonine protein kinase n=1 Tax=Sphingobium sp. UBA5915 TaxID=1947530 RepID=UPI0025FFDE38|nr:protein kinase [Sphingobium sp. UBA5915]
MAKAARLRPGDKVGPWTLEELIGSGGNGVVWRVSRAGQVDRALKILRNLSQTARDRIAAEIEALKLAEDVEGVIPLLEHDLPHDPAKGPRWFVMPLAIPAAGTFGKAPPEKVVTEFRLLAETLARLHERDIHHRDIKPANLLRLGGRLCFSDFGLVKYPRRKEITPARTDVGAKFTMAPEMRREASKANGGPADVYSFAKTMWIALTNQAWGFDGQYSAEGALALNLYHRKAFTAPLDKLLSQCTDNDPARRPTMAEVTERLTDWITLDADFHRRNLGEWLEVQSRLFPLASPSRATWFDPDDIIHVLRQASKTDGLNHMFFPDGGGLTISKIDHSFERGSIRLDCDLKFVVKPLKLTFESFGSGSPWSYFRLEADPVSPTGTEGAYLPDSGYKETICEIRPGEYVEIDAWEYGEYEGEPLPTGARPLSRYLKGSFVIFSTRSPYNLDPATYDARHEKFSEDDFRRYIQRQKDLFDA